MNKGRQEMGARVQVDIALLVRNILLQRTTNDGDMVPRKAIRALLPETGQRLPGLSSSLHRQATGHGTATNRTSDQMQKALRNLDVAGLISRSETHVTVLSREGIAAFEDAGS